MSVSTIDRPLDRPDVAELELRLECRAFATYVLGMRFERPDDDLVNDPLEGNEVVVTLDLDGLSAKALDPAAYGACLTERLFAHPAASRGLHACRSEARSAGWLLRLRLAISASAPELHDVRWETLRDPEHPDVPLLTDETILFSRFLHSGDDRRVRPGSLRERRRALVAIASPTGLPPGLTPIDVAAERERACAGLAGLGFEIEVLARDGPAGEPVTLDALTRRLREPCDLLYLVCHGGRRRPSREPWIALERPDGEVEPVPASDFAARLRQLPRLPLLAVLVSCQSASPAGPAAPVAPAANGRAADADALAALGPRLVEAGVPSVIGMQGDITMRTIGRLLPTFFQELRRSNGMIDRAMTAARAAVRDEPDCWMPALYMRLRSGCLWYEPGLGGDGSDPPPWASLVRNVRDGDCVAILGPELAEPLLGSRREIARRWAEEHRVPLVLEHRDDLAQVAQYLAVSKRRSFPANTLVEHIRGELARIYAGDDPALRRADIATLVAAVGKRLRAANPYDPHRVLARLPLRVYITASPGYLLTDALREAGKRPRVVIAPWNDRVEAERLPDDYEPSVEEPLVYHALGHFDDPASLVLTEDDFFNYLIGITTRRPQIPAMVNRATAESALLFLGFSPEEWSFRVLFSTIMSQEGKAAMSGYDHVAVQMSPDERRPNDPRGVRRYLESYFKSRVLGGGFSVYWGSTEDFLRELLDRSTALHEQVVGSRDEPAGPDRRDGPAAPDGPLDIPAPAAPAGVPVGAGSSGGGV